VKGLCGAGLLVATLALRQEAVPARPEEVLPKAVGPQPVAFSHRRHVEQTGLACELCHAGAALGDAATLPPVTLCLTCHRSIKPDSAEVAKLAAAAEKGEEVPWVPVYRVPDYVFFGHAPHVKAGLDCSSCHGPVGTRDVLQKEVSTSMTACLGCHRQRNAPQTCVACHQLGH
jgi:hypothetical protein